MTPISIVEKEVTYTLEPSPIEEVTESHLPRGSRESLSSVAVNSTEVNQDGVGGFSWEEILFEKTDSMPEALAANWSRLGISRLSQQAFLKLEDLAAEVDGWTGLNSKALRPSSLRHFLEFWNAIRDRAIEPEFALASNGHLSIEWHSSWKKHLDLEFADDGRVLFGLFDGRSILEGVEKGSELSRMLLARKSQPLKWKSR